MRTLLPAVMAIVCLPLPAPALTMLFDFETDEEIKAWTIRSPRQDSLKASTRYATSGKRSAVFRTPEWGTGMQEWPAFEAAPTVRDWSKAHTLLIDLTNPTDANLSLKLFVTDADTPLQQGASSMVALPPRGHQRALIPISSFPKAIDRRGITRLHFFTTRPEAEFVVHLDNIALLAEGEAPPPCPPSYTRELVRLIISPELIRETKALLDALSAKIDTLVDQRSPVRSFFMEQVKALRDAHEKAASAYRDGRMSLGQAERLRDVPFKARAARLESLAALARRSAKTGVAGRCVVGLASSMEKVLPREVPLRVDVRKTASLELARNETEGLQVVVVPLGEDLAGVRVEVGALVSAEGTRLPADCVDVRVVGYVKTACPPYTVSYVGWWPDPLLDFLPEVKVASGDAQAFWVRVRAPKDAAAGTYRGKLRVVAGGSTLHELALDVRVHGFSLPDRSPLPTAMSVYTQFPARFAGKNAAQATVTLADFLADYYIDYDHLYRGGAPEWPVLKRLEKQGRLVAFNLRYFHTKVFHLKMSDEAFAKAMSALVASIRDIYDRAKREGIGEKAYLYGFDERTREYFPMLQRIAAGLKKEFADLKLMTTAYDHSFGLKSGVTDIDAWVPLTPRYDPAKAAEVRKKGNEVWWYICCGPRHPYANWFVDYPAIEARLLMGALTAKYRPDGFLYYAITRWPNNDRPIESGPFTTWNPASYRTYNGDGSLLCPGPGGRPLATIRLENFRDGLEDYAYVRILEATIKAKQAAGQGKLTEKDRAWIERAKSLVTVPEEIVKDMRSYTHEPAVLYEYRGRLARAIDEAGIPAANPWAE